MENGNLSSKRQRDTKGSDAQDRVDQACEASSPDTTCRRATIAALIATVLLSSGIVVATYLSLGEVEALRAVTSLVMPLSVLWLLLFATAMWWFAANSYRLGSAAFVLWVAVTILFNQTVANWAIRSVEWPRSDELSKLDEPLRTAVLLGGTARQDASGTPEIGRDGMRVFSAAQLWHTGQTRTVICTGERAGPGDHQSELARRLLVSGGVPNEVIFEIGGENTSQEMKKLRRFLNSPPPGFDATGPVGLITSAYHMRRVLRLAEANGLDLIPLPCCYRDARREPFTANQLIPGLEAGITMRIALKERLAALVGR